MLRSLILAAALQFAAAPQPPQTVWIIGWDDTTSVVGSAFSEYPDAVRATVLPLVRPSDTMVLVRLLRTREDERTDREPDTVILDSRPSRFTTQVREFYQKLAREQQVRGAHTTDIGRALRHLRASIDLDREAHNSPRSYVLVVVSDGRVEGPQTVGPGKLPPVGDVDYRIVFLGVNGGPAVEATLHKMTVREGFDRRDRELIVPLTHLRQMAGAIPGFVGRTVDATLAHRLDQAASRPPAK